MLKSIYLSIRRRFLPYLMLTGTTTDAAWAAWRNGLYSYRLYKRHPRPKWFRRVFDELIVRDDIWSIETKLPGLSSFYVFDSAAAAADTASAEKAGRAIVDRFHDSMERGTARLVLAARALLIHENLILADRLLLETRQGENPLNAKLDRVFLTLGHAAADLTNRRLIGDLLHQKGVPTGSLIKAWINSRWLHEGPTEDLLYEVLRLADNARGQQLIMLRESLALAFLLNDMTVVKRLLSSNPELEKNYDCVLPLASFLLSTSIGSARFTERARIMEFAELYEQLNAGSASLMASIGDKTRSLARVGNSPCELGSGSGALIDDYDIVARFNLFSTSDEFVSDYGKKCSIHVRLPDRDDTNQCSLNSGLVVFNRADLLYRQRNWENIFTLSRAGATLSVFPTGFHRELYKKLGAEPSAGITFCALVKAVRGRLPRASCFGFSFVDQIGKDATSAHYFRQARPSFKHLWFREKTMFEELTAMEEEASLKRDARAP
jgi:hypothetical protein